MVELERLVIGVMGKLALWEALQSVVGPSPGGVDLAALEERARKQREALDALRRKAATEAFAG